MPDRAKTRLYNTLLKKGWKRIKEDHPEGEVLSDGFCEVLFLPTGWELYFTDKGKLTFGVWYHYSRRQSQQLAREVKRFSKWRSKK